MVRTKTALITGISGQDGAYLAELLLQKGYRVVGAFRRAASQNMWRLNALGIRDAVELAPLDMVEFTNILRVLENVKPDEIYNLAAQSFVGTSFEQPIYTSDVDAMGVLRLLECMRTVCPSARFYQASTSEMFGKAQTTPQNEQTPFYPRSPYGVAKLFAHHITVNYRESYGLHASSGILFNHESPLRGREFVTRKVTRELAQIKRGEQQVLELGNLDAFRDWGFARDYVDGMWRMLQRDEGGDFVLATGRKHSVREFVELSAQVAGIRLRWEGEGEQTRALDADGVVRVRVNPKFFRPAEVDLLIGDASKARTQLGWQPETSFERLVEMMVKADLDAPHRDEGAG